MAFPPFVYAQFGNIYLASLPFGPFSVYNDDLLYAVGMPLALAWSIIVRGIMASRTGSTPGKRMKGLRVISESGTRVSLSAGIIRRLSFLLGPAAWLDWVPALRGDRQRILDHLAETRVIVTIPDTVAAASHGTAGKTRGGQS